MSNLKDYRKDELPKYILANAIMLLFLIGKLEMDTETTSIGIELLGMKFLHLAGLASVLYIYVFLLDSLIPDTWKYKMVYLYRTMPGTTIFDDIKSNPHADIRFTYEKVREKYPIVYERIDEFAPCEKEERRKFENQEWYHIYSDVKEEGAVYYSHRDFLMLRDMYVSTGSLAMVSVVLSLMGMIQISLSVVMFFLLMLVMTNIATVHKGKRFAYNVIAVSLSKRES